MGWSGWAGWGGVEHCGVSGAGFWKGQRAAWVAASAHVAPGDASCWVLANATFRRRPVPKQGTGSRARWLLGRNGEKGDTARGCRVRPLHPPRLLLARLIPPPHPYTPPPQGLSLDPSNEGMRSALEEAQAAATRPPPGAWTRVHAYSRRGAGGCGLLGGGAEVWKRRVQLRIVRGRKISTAWRRHVPLVATRIVQVAVCRTACLVPSLMPVFIVLHCPHTHCPKTGPTPQAVATRSPPPRCSCAWPPTPAARRCWGSPTSCACSQRCRPTPAP